MSCRRSAQGPDAADRSTGSRTPWGAVQRRSTGRGGDTLCLMPTVVLDPPPAAFEALLEHRRRLGLDRRDEIWKGVLHMAPAPLRRHADLQAQLMEHLGPPARAAGLRTLGEFNLGEEDDYRIPDAALLEPGPDALYVPSAALVVEILSPDDETIQKLPFYAAHQIAEVLIVDPEQRSLRWLALAEGEYRPAARSALIDLGSQELAERIDWPPVDADPKSPDSGN